MKRALVTGATGFVGANLAARLLGDGHDVHLLARPGSDRWRLSELEEHARVHEVDLTDAAAVDDVISAIGAEWIFHLAAHGGYSWQSDPRRIVGTNVLGSLNVVEAALKTGFESFVNTGSSSEYGFKDHAPPESDRLEPNSYYAVAKASGTLLCSFVGRSRDVRISTLRLYSVYGPYEEPGRLVPSLVLHALDGRLPPLVSPQIARDFVYVEDVTHAFLRAAEGAAPGSVYNVGSGIQTSLEHAVGAVRRVFGVTAEPAWDSMGARSWDTTVWVADVRKIGDDLAWRPRYSFEDGLRELAAWFADVPPEIRERYAVRAAEP